MLEILKQSSNPDLCKELLQAVIEKAREFYDVFGRKPAFMEVCGSHTMALAKSGVKQCLINDVKLVSGPGCPVCVTDQKSIDAMIALSEGQDRIICTFGDMVRVPGSTKTLLDAKTAGKDIRVLYSPVDAVRLAEENPDKEVIFLGIGFETTIPIIALLVGQAHSKQLKTFQFGWRQSLLNPFFVLYWMPGKPELMVFTSRACVNRSWRKLLSVSCRRVSCFGGNFRI